MKKFFAQVNNTGDPANDKKALAKLDPAEMAELIELSGDGDEDTIKTLVG
jgi:hypothetical protein